MSNAIRRRPDARLILLLGALAACGPIATDMYLPSLPSMAESLGTSAAAVQWTLTSFLAGFSIGMLLYGPLSDSPGAPPRAARRHRAVHPWPARAASWRRRSAA